MKDIKIISHSITLVDNAYNGIMPLGKNQLQVRNPFDQIAQPLVLKALVGKSVETLANSDIIHREFKYENIKITYDFFPPRLNIINEENNLSDTPKNLALQIIELAEIKDKLGSIGVNYELFIEENDVNLTQYLLQEFISKEFNSLSTTLVLVINKDVKLNLRIADAEIEGKKGIYFQANFSNQVSTSNNVEKILENNNFLNIAKEKINLIFNKEVINNLVDGEQK